MTILLFLAAVEGEDFNAGNHCGRLGSVGSGLAAMRVFWNS